MAGDIIACGGHWSEWQKYALAQTEGSEPRVGFLPTATGDSEKEIALFYSEHQDLLSRPDHFSIFSDFAASDPAAWVEEQDVIVLPGGREEVAKASWNEEGLTQSLKDFWQEGGVILASEEGAGLLFALSLDRHGNPFRGFSFLPYSFCLNYTNYGKDYRQFVARGLLGSGYGLSRGAALHFRGSDLWRSLAFNTLFDVVFVESDGRERLQDMTFLY